MLLLANRRDGSCMFLGVKGKAEFRRREAVERIKLVVVRPPSFIARKTSGIAMLVGGLLKR